MTFPVFIEISDEPLKVGKPRQDGSGNLQPAKSRQHAYVHQGNKHPTPFLMRVDPEKGPLRPGRYLIAGQCFSAGEYDQIDFKRWEMQLISVEEATDLLTQPGTSKPAPLKAAG